MFVPEAVFSAMERVVLVPSVKTGASLASVTLIVTLIVSVKLPSEAVTVTE